MESLNRSWDCGSNEKVLKTYENYETHALFMYLSHNITLAKLFYEGCE